MSNNEKAQTGVRQERRERRKKAEQEVRKAFVEVSEYINSRMNTEFVAGITLSRIRALVEHALSKDTKLRFQDIIDYEMLQLEKALTKLGKDRG